jgi:hypothetical protein
MSPWSTAVHSGAHCGRPHPPAANAYSSPSSVPADATYTTPFATAGVSNTPLLSCAVHSGVHSVSPQPLAGNASSSPPTVPT